MRISGVYVFAYVRAYVRARESARGRHCVSYLCKLSRDAVSDIDVCIYMTHRVSCTMELIKTTVMELFFVGGGVGGL